VGGRGEGSSRIDLSGPDLHKHFNLVMLNKIEKDGGERGGGVEMECGQKGVTTTYSRGCPIPMQQICFSLSVFHAV
jgi:hypothetical protein